MSREAQVPKRQGEASLLVGVPFSIAEISVSWKALAAEVFAQKWLMSNRDFAPTTRLQ
jgi:hypothetical protein